MAYPDHISQTERNIIDAILQRALARGCVVTVFDGKKPAVLQSSDYAAITSAIGATNETTLSIRDDGRDKIGEVVLAHGKGEGVVSDYTDNPATRAIVIGGEE